MKLKFLLLFLLVPHIAFSYYLCRPCCSRNQLPGWWGSAEYLLLWRKARFYPPLVTTNPTALPILGSPGTTVLFGDEEVGGCPKSGGRGDIGAWLTRCMGFGAGGFFLVQEEVDFNLSGSAEGIPIFGQPFFNVPVPGPDVLLLSFPGLRGDGFIDIETVNRIWGVDLYARYRYLCSPCFKFDLMVGFQFSRLTDNLDINTQTSPIPPIFIQTVAVTDHFGCQNDFYAGLVGFNTEWRSKCWAINVIGKVGIGNMHKIVDIFGNSTTIIGGVPTYTNTGFLTQPSNIGVHTVNKFEVIPQISANVQLKIWKHMWLTAGYTYMFWPSVALAGEQVDLNVNLSQVPGPPVGPLVPVFPNHETSFWIQGLTAGLYFCY